MWISSALASIHYLGLAVGLGGIFARGVFLRDLSRQPEDARLLKRLFFADNLWGLAALLWIATGLLRAFGGYEKASDFYLQNSLFWLKMGLFGAIFLLELRPMVFYIRLRRAKERAPEILRSTSLPFFIRVNDVETVLTVIIPFVASAMARGLLF